MKFECPECGRISYSSRNLTSCNSCGGNLKDISDEKETTVCPVTGRKIRIVDGIPNCEDFRLVNAVGQRCTHPRAASRCPSSSLPTYDPRVGVKPSSRKDS